MVWASYGPTAKLKNPLLYHTSTGMLHAVYNIFYDDPDSYWKKHKLLSCSEYTTYLSLLKPSLWNGIMHFSVWICQFVSGRVIFDTDYLILQSIRSDETLPLCNEYLSGFNLMTAIVKLFKVNGYTYREGNFVENIPASLI